MAMANASNRLLCDSQVEHHYCIDVNSLLSHRCLLSFIFSFFGLIFFCSDSVKLKRTSTRFK